MSTDDQSVLVAHPTVRRSISSFGETIVVAYGGLVVAGGLVLSGGVFSLVAAVVALLAALGLTTPFALAVCILLISTVDPPLSVALALSGCGLVIIALAGFDSMDTVSRAIVAFALLFVLIGGVTVLAWVTLPAWLATLAVLATIATLGYGIHRYERVMLGLVTDDTPAAEGEP